MAQSPEHLEAMYGVDNNDARELLRRRFALECMTALMSNPSAAFSQPRNLVKTAVEAADALLIELKI